jgi:hypothetical protein
MIRDESGRVCKESLCVVLCYALLNMTVRSQNTVATPSQSNHTYIFSFLIIVQQICKQNSTQLLPSDTISQHSQYSFCRTDCVGHDRVERPTGASVLSRCKKSSFLQIVETPSRWVSRAKMLRHATINSTPNGLKLYRPPNKQPIHDTGPWHSVKSRITYTKSPSFCMTIFSTSLTNLTLLLPQSHYCTCYVSRIILAPTPLWLQKHTDLPAYHIAHSVDLRHRPRPANISCAWTLKLRGNNPGLHRLHFYVTLSISVRISEQPREAVWSLSSISSYHVFQASDRQCLEIDDTYLLQDYDLFIIHLRFPTSFDAL